MTNYGRKQIEDILGFFDLTSAQQREILNGPNNLQPLPKPFNCSKGCKSGLDWDELKSKGVKIDPAYKELLEAKQDQMNVALREKIQAMNTANSKGRP